MEFIVPPLEHDLVEVDGKLVEWPSLGSQVGDWQEANLGFGPGDLLGSPYRLDDEDRAFLELMYQVYPYGHQLAGRRRFKSAVLMLRKGSKKSERAGALAASELAEDGPVRCDGFRREGKIWVPVGRPIVSPFVFIFAFAKEQAEDTSWDAMKAMIEQGPGVDKFQIWQDRILRRGGDGEAKAMASAPDSRDGGRTTFQIKEEPHRWTFPRQLEAHQTTRNNLSKRPAADPWEFFPTTAYAPGEGSVAEQLHDDAKKLSGEAARSSRMFFFYRFADEKIEIRDKDGDWRPDQLHKAIAEASGPHIAKWSDLDDIAERQFMGPGCDVNYAERVWLNRTRRTLTQGFDIARFKELADPRDVDEGAVVVAAWHGARYWDSAGLVVTEVATGYQFIPRLETGLACWQRPENAPDSWEVPDDDVEAAIDALFATWTVFALYVHPDRWETNAARWAADYGAEIVKQWRTNAWTDMTRACRAYEAAIAAGEIRHSGQPELVAQLGAATRRYLSTKDDDGKPTWVITKERQDSPHPVNVAQAAIVSWQARTDALKAGALQPVEWGVS